ncbi:hypothetical protein GCM10011514_38990 [Emticicia aquatilis]|uniref:DUF3108 domain-containing protein n=1 Tax=Emticicia aquatilis TaxID=1537369 RepID=A0A916Z1C0_9BACT|nr:hypothetical protein [Emticicia aquatilis]GGD71094.1 hypothetical protein GCM10011514_38990 [Emticicia aquatilis]
MKLLLLTILLLPSAFDIFAQQDTIEVNSKNLKINDIHFGNSTYIIYSKNGENKPAQRNTLVKVNVSKQNHNGREAIAINQVWEAADTTEHRAFSLLRANDLSTIQHDYWWKRTGQKISLDFEKRTANLEGKFNDTQKEKFMKDFNIATESGNFLNWHCDMVIFPLLPFKENAVFKIRFHDPGIKTPTNEIYTIIKSETLKGLGDEKIDCWVMEYALPKGMNGYQRYWIAKKTREFIKEEDKVNNFYRIKLRMIVSETDI